MGVTGQERNQPVEVQAPAVERSAPSRGTTNGSVRGANPATAEPYWRPGLRFLLAVAIAAGICLLIFQLAPRTLDVQTDIVGYPTFANFAYEAPFWAWRLTVYVFPVLSFLLYVLLARVGPLRRGSRPARRSIALADRPGPAPVVAPDRAFLLRIAVPFIVVVWVAGSRSGHYGRFAAAAVLAYLAAVAATALVIAWWTMRRQLGFGWRQLFPPGRPFWSGLALANGVGGAVAAILGLWYVSAHTWVTAARVRYPLPWLPGWVALVAVTAVLAWTVWRGRRGLSTWDIERRLIVFVGAVGLFLAVSFIPGPLRIFHGFDDALELTGANLTSQGLEPWRDLMFMHGLFPDVWRGTISISVFGDTAWALPAGLAMFFTPLTWVFVYLLAAWASRSNPWVLLTVFVAAVSGFVPQLETRFMTVPLSLIVLGVALRRRTPLWSVILVLVLLAQAVLVPEASFLALPALACVVLVDLVHRPAGSDWRCNLRMTRWCVVTGLVGLTILVVVLGVLGMLPGFIDYYKMITNGHNLSGAIGPTNITPVEIREVAVGVLAVLLTAWSVAARIRRRGDWQPADWVTLAAAGFVALYGEKFLGHFDKEHVWQFATVELSLVALWVWKLGSLTAGVVARFAGERLSRFHLAGRPGAPALAGNTVIAVMIVVVVAVSHTFWPTIRTVDRRHQMAYGDPVSAVDRLGFATANAVDPVMMRDLDTVLRTYAPDNQPVFDFTNSPGYFYYLLNRRAGTRFNHIVLAIPPDAQRTVIAELKRSRPPVVIFDADHLGVAVWDTIANNVRHYLVAQYILDGWTPVLRTHGTLILVRRDLVGPGRPIPRLVEPPITRDLWFGRPCDWGFAPDFMPLAQRGPDLRLPVRRVGPYEVVNAHGWAVDAVTGRAASEVLVAVGDQVIASVVPSVLRRGQPPGAVPEGFVYAGGRPGRARLGYYLVSADGMAHPLAGSRAANAFTLHRPDGRVLTVSPIPYGQLEQQMVSQHAVGEVTLPTDVVLGHYPMATIAGPDPLGRSDFTLTDQVGEPSHTISFSSRAGFTRPSLPVRVGSCTQWRGFQPGRPLYVTQTAGAPITSLTLSDATT